MSAKTGSLQGVYNLAGFITTASGQRMAFVQYLSGYAVPPADQRARRFFPWCVSRAGCIKIFIKTISPLVRPAQRRPGPRFQAIDGWR
ncbi:D-alanyl-D-alanine carboxypeptidase [Candidatus Sodalis endolongispinus]|uniref:D-alanyl-D-alanine carboxypeptidase n=1 Tax=Candidatus Sodalis endolongispinus TaxID=2812662 RepID=UPI0028AC6151|nr:D-alanyl-D-alanine carboxypeptidase [Candidatus Sodalis endolongispinus]